jgi:predicted  nucleic acid-binding Zn-ribbon protein
MKILKFAAVIFIVTSLFSCNQAELDKLKKENQELKDSTNTKDSSINGMMEAFGEIQTNLQEIKRREGMIEVKTAESGANGDISKSINNDIKLISNLMQRNEKLIKQLNKELSASSSNNKEFKKIVKNLNARIDGKNQEIADLNTELTEKKIKIGQLYYSVDSLRMSNRMREKELEQVIDESFQGFYAYGSFKELKESNVLTKEGGFLGLGKTKELKGNFNEKYFSKIDTRKQKSFLIYADKAKLITTHPEDSYEFMGKDGRADSLVVKNPEAFWKASKYMVIVIE